MRARFYRKLSVRDGDNTRTELSTLLSCLYYEENLTVHCNVISAHWFDKTACRESMCKQIKIVPKSVLGIVSYTFTLLSNIIYMYFTKSVLNNLNYLLWFNTTLAEKYKLFDR